MDSTAKGKSCARLWARKSKGNRPLSFTPDIVVVHDLEGPEFACEEGGGELVAWFEDVLIADYPDAHILSCCPIPDAFAETLLTGYGFQIQAWELLSSIQQLRERDHRTGSEIIFLASGTGLLVVEQALVLAHHDQRFQSISHETSLIGFLEAEALKETGKSWEEISLRTAVRLHQRYGWGIATTLSRLATTMKETHDAFTLLSGRYKTLTSKQTIALRTEKATDEVLSEWQVLSSQIRRLAMPFLEGSQQSLHAVYGRDARNLILSKFAPSHVRRLIPYTACSQAHDLIDSDTTYQSWRNNGNAGVFYVYGGGKMETAQVTGISAEDTAVTAYLSFEDVPCFERTVSTVIKVLIYRFLVTVAPAFDIIRPVLHSFGQIPNYNVEELWALLGSLLSCPDVQFIYYIIDGIDLCNDSITDQLEALVEMAHARSMCCKVLATSRTLSNATSGKAPALVLNPLLSWHGNLKDFVRRTMLQLMTQTRGLAELEQVIVNGLQGSASPSDINIRLQALLHFARPLSVCSIERSLPLLQKPLSELYAWMLGPLDALMPWVRRALSWMVLSFRPLSIHELAIAVLIPDSLEEQELLRQLPLDLEGDLTRALGPLIEIRNGQPMFASDSVREYIRRKLTANSKFGTDAQACDVLSHVDLTRHCLTYLKRSWAAQASPTDDWYTFLGESGMELSEYAARYWPYHYHAEEDRGVLSHDIVDFFSQDKYGKRWAEWWRNAHCFVGTDSFKSTPLALAAEHGLCEVVSNLLCHTEDKSVSSQEKTEALEVALHFGHLDVARQLLLDTNPSDKSLTLASRTGDTDLVINILNKLDVSESVCLESLQVAVIRGHLRTIDILLLQLADLPSAPLDNTYLYLDAIRSGQFQVLKHLLNVGVARLPEEVESSLLRLAAQRGDIGVIRLLLAEGFSADEKDENGWTILHHSADNRRANVVTELLPSHDAEAKDCNGMLPLHLVCKNGSISTFNALMTANNLSFKTPNSDGDQPIHLAAAGGHLQVVVRLVEMGADPNIPNRRGFTPLHLAAQAGHLAVVRELIRRAGDRLSVSQTSEESPYIGSREDVSEQIGESAAAGNSLDAHKNDSSSGGDEEEEGEREEDESSDGDAEEEAENQDYAHEPTPLHSAALRGYDDVVRELLEAHADTNYGNQHGKTPLHLAVQDGQTAVVKALLDGGANPSLCDMDGRLPIHLASEVGNIFIFRALQQAVSYVEAVDDRGRTPLHICARHAYAELVELLLDQGADPNSSNADGQSPLYCAIQSGNPQVFKLLLDAGAKIKSASQTQAALVYEAVFAGQDKDVVRLLMEAGCDPLAKSSDSMTSLELALAKNDRAMVLQLLERVGPNTPSLAEYSEGLFWLAYRGCIEGVKKVLKEAGDGTLECETLGMVPLHVAAIGGHEEVLQFLLERGSNPNARASNKKTPLIYACIGIERVGIVRRLLDAGANPDLEFGGGFRALHCAIESKSDDIVQLLLERGASLPSATKTGDTILGSAFQHRMPSVVELLLQRGANPFEIHRGKTVIEWAIMDDDPAYLNHMVHYGIGMVEAGSIFTPLHLAAMIGNLELMKKHSSSLGARDTVYQRTALHWVAYRGELEALKLLIYLGEEVSVQDKRGRMALHLAASCERREVLEALIQKDDRCITSKDIHGWAPIHIARAYGRTEAVSILSGISRPGVLEVPSCYLPSRLGGEEESSTKYLLAERGLKVITGGIDNDETRILIRADHPMPIEKDVYYYEVAVSRAATDKILGIGFSEENAEEDGMPGWRDHSWGYHSDNGNLYAESGKGKEYGPIYGDGDVVGCGVDFDAQCAFFTCNGKILGTFPCKLQGIYYPVFGYGENGIEITTNFGPGGFRFEGVDSYCWRKEIESQDE